MKSKLDRIFQIPNSHIQVVHFSNHSFFLDSDLFL